MAAGILGPEDISALGVPTGVDPTRLLQWRLREGMTYSQFVSMVSLALGSFNAEMAQNWDWLYALTEELFIEYPDGTGNSEMPEITDYDKLEMIHGDTLGHMLPIKTYGRAVGGSWMWFRDTRQAKVVAMIKALVTEARWRFEKRLLTRLFTNTENAIGSGYDVPFVNGTGNVIDYTPLGFDGTTFTTSHDHYIGIDSDSKTRADQMEEMAAHLQEHGHMAPYQAIVSKTDAAAFSVLGNYITTVDAGIEVIDMGGQTSAPRYIRRGQKPFNYVGAYQTSLGLVDLYGSNRVPTKYAAMFKSYGRDDERNPLRVRVRPDVGFGAYIVPETSDNAQWPLKKLAALFEFGVGVGADRTNGVVSFFDSTGTWTPPAIS